MLKGIIEQALAKIDESPEVAKELLQAALNSEDAGTEDAEPTEDEVAPEPAMMGARAAAIAPASPPEQAAPAAAAQRSAQIPEDLVQRVARLEAQQLAVERRERALRLDQVVRRHAGDGVSLPATSRENILALGDRGVEAFDAALESMPLAPAPPEQWGGEQPNASPAAASELEPYRKAGAAAYRSAQLAEAEWRELTPGSRRSFGSLQTYLRSRVRGVNLSTNGAAHAR